MFSQQDNKALSGYMRIMAGVLLLGVAFAPQIAPAATVNELVAKAKQEGALIATVISDLSERATPKLAAAFNKRFGLDLRVTLTPVTDTENYPRAIAEAKAGTVPSFDAIEGSEINNISLVGAGGLDNVGNWESLLAEINPLVRDKKARPEQISPIPLSGYAFEYFSRVKAILYNPRLISRNDLPRTHAELANPKYKGKWTQPPWTSHWDIGPFVFPEIAKEKWLEIVRNAGKNAGAVQTEQRGVERVLLGEFDFAIANTHYAFHVKAKDPNAPVEITYFQDYNQGNGSYYGVRKGSRHPAAAALFALWMGTPEAESIWQADNFATQYKWGESKLDRMDRELIKKIEANIVELVSTQKGRDFLAWYGTEEGRKFRQAVGKAIRGE